MNIQKIGNETMPSATKNPFMKNCIERIWVDYSKEWFTDNWIATGTVSFKNGDTKGEQKFKGENFDEVVYKIKNYINNELK